MSAIRSRLSPGSAVHSVRNAGEVGAIGFGDLLEELEEPLLRSEEQPATANVPETDDFT